MIAADQLQNRSGFPTASPFGHPTSAEQVFLNSRQVSGMLEVPYGRLREALLTRRIKPCSVDGHGHAMFKATRLHELARLLDSDKARTAFEFRFGPEWAEVSVITVVPPQE